MSDPDLDRRTPVVVGVGQSSERLDVDGYLEDRGYGLAGLMSMYQASHGLTGAPEMYALLENARRARLGLSRADYAASMGALFEPFTRVAAKNPHSSAPVERSAAELV